MNIRKIEKKDNVELAQVIKSVLKEHGEARPGTVYTDPTTDSLFELFEEDNSVYWVVEDKSKILGGCGLYPTKGLSENCIELVKLYLSSDARGKGVGKLLMNKCIEYAKQMGYSQVYLETIPALSSAVGLYESLGFVRLDHPLGDSGHFACNVWMLKDLK
ncbi:MAG: GNAT family N-acetyltransferase [Crocinitomicaceae bacterium]|nr:GNAT family N-acetyltransferase [Crocinitomicaceae bacterium]